MRYWKLVLPALLIVVMVFGLVNSVSAQPPQYRIRIRAPAQVEVCSEFEVNIIVEPLTAGTFYDALEFRVMVDPNFMKIVDSGYEVPTGWSTSGGTSDTEYYFQAQGPNLYGSWTWATLLIHCEGPGLSAIVFDQDPNTTFIIISGVKGYTLEFGEPIVSQREVSNPVGGFLTSTNKLTVLAPYLGLVCIVAAVASAVVMERRRKD